MSILFEFIRFLMFRKKYWMVPIFLILVLFGGLLFLSQGSVLAPFVYALF